MPKNSPLCTSKVMSRSTSSSRPRRLKGFLGRRSELAFERGAGIWKPLQAPRTSIATASDIAARILLGSATPEGTGPVDPLDLVGDAVLAAVVLDGGATVVEPVVIDDQVAPGRESRVEVDEAVHRRLIQVSVQADHGPPVLAQARQRLVEPSRK